MDGDACVQTEDNESFLPLLVGRLPQQLEVRAPEDDWSGLTDPEKRRRLQNRLNQRAWSKCRLTSPHIALPNSVEAFVN
jgi:hypothetical protein